MIKHVYSEGPHFCIFITYLFLLKMRMDKIRFEKESPKYGKIGKKKRMRLVIMVNQTR